MLILRELTPVTIAELIDLDAELLGYPRTIDEPKSNICAKIINAITSSFYGDQSLLPYILKYYCERANSITVTQ